MDFQIYWFWLRIFKLRKAINLFKILISFYDSKSRKKSNLKGMPVAISVEPTTSCNLRCPQCVSGLRSFTRPTGMMEMALFKKIINELKSDLLYLNLYFQGEPYLNTVFLEMVKYAHQHNIYTSTSTNAHFLNKENAEATVKSGLNRLIISIDGVSQESYEKYRVGGDLEKVWEGIENLQNAKKLFHSAHPQIVLQFIVFQHNELEIDAIIEKSKNLKVNLQLKTAQVYDEEGRQNLLPKNKKYSRYENNIPLEDSCWKMWHSSVITWDGKVVPCCFDKDAHYVLGDMNKSSFTDIWQGDQYQKFRNHLFTSRKEIDICSNCSEGSKVYV